MRLNTPTAPWAVCLFLTLACLYLLRENSQIKPQIITRWKVRTEVRVDTVHISAPMAVFARFTADTIHIRDTIRIDDTLVLPRQEVIYQDSLYRAVISGYRPRLDHLELFPRTTTHTLTPQLKPKRWGIGLQAGYGLPYGPYIGLGVSYNLVRW